VVVVVVIIIIVVVVVVAIVLLILETSPSSNYNVYAYIVKHNYILGGMLFTICKAQPHVSATNVGQLQVVQRKNYQSDIHASVGGV